MKSSNFPQNTSSANNSRRPDGRVGTGGDSEIAIQQIISISDVQSPDHRLPHNSGVFLREISRCAYARLDKTINKQRHIFQYIGQPFIIRVKKCDRFIDCGGSSAVPCLRYVGIPSVNDAKASVFTLHGKIASEICRSVINNNNFCSCQCLCRNRIQRSFNRFSSLHSGMTTEIFIISVRSREEKSPVQYTHACSGTLRCGDSYQYSNIFE